MDINERMAANIEKNQTERYRKSPDKDNFWTDEEKEIFEAIKLLRAQSSTYHPDNQN